MAKTPRDANGRTPITSSDHDARTLATEDRQRVRRRNAVEPSPSIAREERASTTQEPHRDAVNAIRPTPRRLRSEPFAEDRTRAGHMYLLMMSAQVGFAAAYLV